jgi:hypothetical protein
MLPAFIVYSFPRSMQSETNSSDFYSHLRPVAPLLLHFTENVYLAEYASDNFPKWCYDKALVAALEPFDQAIASFFIIISLFVSDFFFFGQQNHRLRDPKFTDDPVLGPFLASVRRLAMTLEEENVPACWNEWFCWTRAHASGYQVCLFCPLDVRSHSLSVTGLALFW